MDTAISPQSYGRGVLAAIAVLAALAAVILLAAGLPLHGLALGAAVLGPFALYAALTRPLMFPFGLYVLLVPFDNLLGAGPFGTVTKLLGIVSGAFLLLWIARRGSNAASFTSLLPPAALVLWMLASAFWSLDQSAALQILPTYAGLIILYVALVLSPLSIQDFQVILGCTIVGGLAAAVYGANVFYHDPALAHATVPARLVIQVGTSSIDPNHFANSLLFPAAALAMWALRTPRILAKLAGIAGLGVLITGILLSGSREALIAFAALTLYLLWRSRYRLQLLLASAAVIAIVQSVQTSMWQRFATALSTGGSGRTSIWAVALEAAKHRPIQGYGIGNFEAAYDTFYLSVYQTYPYGWSSPAHNIVFHYAVELGIVGLALLGWFFWQQFRSLADVGDRSPLYDYRVMLEGALLAIVIVSFSVDLFTYKYAWLVFATVALFHNASMKTDSQSRYALAESRHYGGTPASRMDGGLPAQAEVAQLADLHPR